MMEEERSDVSEEQRRHCSLLLGEAGCWREEGVMLVGAAGQVRDCLIVAFKMRGLNIH